MRKDQPAVLAPSAVPEGWHPFALRNKPSESVTETPPLVAASYSATAVIDAIGHLAAAGKEEG